MANPEHLAKLKEGVAAWNQWRDENPEIEPDLSRTNLEGVNCENANLSSARLIGTKLESVNLVRAHLYSANLENAKLIGSNLYRAKLIGANLENANLIRANLVRANLIRTNLRDAILREAILREAILKEADLYRAIIIDADLRDADLESAILENAQLQSAILSNTILNKVQALATNFEGVTLTGAGIKDWHINSQTNLYNVKCDYIYLKGFYSEEEERWIFEDRVPHDPDQIFAPGEFTKRYQKILETVNLYFGEGIDWQVFLNSFQKLQKEERIKIADGSREIPIVQGIENTGDGSFVIKIGVSPDADKGEIEKSFWQKYQPMLEAQEEKYRILLRAKDEQIKDFRQQNTQLFEIIKLKANQTININQPINITQKQGDNKVIDKRDIKIEKGNYNENIKGNYYEQKGNFGIGHMSDSTFSGNAKVAGVINEAAQQDLAQAAAEIQQLLDQLSKTYPTKTLAQKGAVADKAIEEIKNNPALLKKVTQVIDVSGINKLAEVVDRPIFNLAKDDIEIALESES